MSWTQKRLADEQEELGALNQSIHGLRRAGVIVLPDNSFLSFDEANEMQVSVKEHGIEAQFLKCVKQCIADESMPPHSVFYLE